MLSGDVRLARKKLMNSEVCSDYLIRFYVQCSNFTSGKA